MKNKNLIVGISISVFLGIIGTAWVQKLHSVPEVATYPIGPLPPAQLAAARARDKKMGDLAWAALKAIEESRYEEAEDYARQSLAVGYGSGFAQELLATSLTAQGKTQEALQAYKMIADAGDVQPRNEIPYALLLLKTGHWAEAVAAYNKSTPYLGSVDIVRANSHFSPEVPQPKQLAVALHIAQGMCYDGASWIPDPQHEEAMREYEKAWQLAPDSVVTNHYYGYGWLHLGMKSPLRAVNASKAKAAFQKVSALGAGKEKKEADDALRGIDATENWAKISKQSTP